MSSFENPAESAFVSNFPQEDGGNQPTPDISTGQPPAVQPQATPQPSVTPTQESLLEQAKIDLNGLPEEQQLYLRQREREMQSHMTRRLQEAADARREAEQASAFMNALNSDPTFALGVLTQLQQNLSASGYLDGGAGTDGYYDDGSGDYQDQQGPDPYAAQLSQIQAQQEAMQQYFVEQQLATELDGQLNTLRGQHPDWSDSDWQAVVDLGFATGGNLYAAADRHGAYRDSVLQGYIDKKQSVTAPAVLPQGGHATPVAQGAPKTDAELRAAAMERIRAELS